MPNDTKEAPGEIVKTDKAQANTEETRQIGSDTHLYAEQQNHKETELRQCMRRFVVAFRQSKCEPIKIADEGTFQLRHGLTLIRSELASTYQSQVYPAKRQMPFLSTATIKPADPTEGEIVARLTVLDKCFPSYRKHFCEHSIKLIKFLGTPVQGEGTKHPQTATLRHASLVRVFETFVSDKKAYIFMEQFPSAPLSTSIKLGSGLTFNETHQIARQVADALFFLSRNGLAHLNVRADNFLWNQDQQIKLVGLSRLFVFWDIDLEQKILHKSISEKNYMDHFPPEVCKEDVDFDASLVDSFSFAVLLYQMLVREKPFTKWHPFNGKENMEKLWKENCKANHDRMKIIPAPVMNLLQLLLTSKPEERPKMEQLLEHPFFQAYFGKVNETA